MLENKKEYPKLPTCDDRSLWDIWMSRFHFPALSVADEFGLFPLLEQTPSTTEEVAKNFSLGVRATEALLGIMTSLGYLVQLNGKFHLTEVSQNFLLPDSPYYWGGTLRFWRDQPVSHSALMEALQQEKATIYEEKDIWETHNLEIEKARTFTAHMHSQTISAAVGAAWRGDFEGVTRLLDLGGGSGVFSFTLARRYPQMRFTILELPTVCQVTKEYIYREGLQNRIDTLEADFFKDPWPLGYDAVLLSNIFHSWGWEKCLQLGRKSFEILPSGGRIYLNELLLMDTKDTPLVATSFSIFMLWQAEGKVYTAGEIEQLLAESGFEDISIRQTCGYQSLISARKP